MLHNMREKQNLLGFVDSELFEVAQALADMTEDKVNRALRLFSKGMEDGKK